MKITIPNGNPSDPTTISFEAAKDLEGFKQRLAEQGIRAKVKSPTTTTIVSDGVSTIQYNDGEVEILDNVADGQAIIRQLMEYKPVDREEQRAKEIFALLEKYCKDDFKNLVKDK